MVGDKRDPMIIHLNTLGLIASLTDSEKQVLCSRGLVEKFVNLASGNSQDLELL
ncbi:MAG: hypothetical protein NZM26_01760 [Patescibacteria group bacterium]|nr:hypothetical protein [Patescibacteria group bacterium]